jgi:H+/Cl- antiporter ClcA
MTSQLAFFIVTGIIFGLVALFHALRLAFRWQVRINQREIPMWVSTGGFVVAAALCIWALWLFFK